MGALRARGKKMGIGDEVGSTGCRKPEQSRHDPSYREEIN